MSSSSRTVVKGANIAYDIKEGIEPAKRATGDEKDNNISKTYSFKVFYSATDDMLHIQNALGEEINGSPFRIGRASFADSALKSSKDNVEISFDNYASATRVKAIEDDIAKIKANPAVFDIVATKAALDSTDWVSKGITDQDIVEVLVDETQGNTASFYRWSDATSSFALISAVPTSITNLDGQIYTENTLVTWMKSSTTKSGRYAIKSELYGPEIVMINKEGEDPEYSRITASGKVYGYSVTKAKWIQVSGGGGGGGSGSDGTGVTFTMITPATSDTYTVSTSDVTKIVFSWSSNVAGAGTLYVYANGTLKETIGVEQGQNEVDISSFISSANTYSIKLTVEDNDGWTKSNTYVIKSVQLVISSTFDSSTVKTGDFYFYYNPIGKGIDKTVHFVMDGVDSTEVVSTTGVIQNHIFGGLTHGTHTLEVYMTADANGKSIESNHLSYQVMYAVAGSVKPILASDFSTTSGTYGDIIAIPYYIYTPDSLTSSVIVTKDGVSTQYDDFDRSKQSVNLGLLSVGAHTVTIASASDPSISKSWTITISKSDIDIQAVTANMSLFLDSSSKNQGDKTWTYGSYSTTFDNFNWKTNGWVDDKDGLKALKLTGAARATINYQPFANDFRATGKTIEFEFSTENVLDFDSDIVNIMSGDIGIEIKPSKFIMKSSEKTISNEFKEGDHLRVSVVIGNNSTDGRFVLLYINGVISDVSVYASSTTFQQTAPVSIVLGSDHADLNLYKIRVYDVALSPSNMLDNWIADDNVPGEKAKAYNRNQIYDQSMNVLYSKVKEIIPVITITAEKLPVGKDEKQTASSVKLENPLDSTLDWEQSDVTLSPQGTSSLQYPYKNFKMKFKTASVQLETGAIYEKTVVLKADYASSCGVYNAGNAKLVNNLYASSDYNPRRADNPAQLRDAIYGYPVACFYKKTATDTPEFYYKGSLNLDKASLALGYQDGDESWSVEDNASSLCNFNSVDFSDSAALSSAFKARYPDAPSFDKLEALINWVYSCKTDENSYVSQKFKDEYEAHFNKYYLLMYYVFGMVMGGIDSFTKNMYLTYFSQTERWYPQFYDLDTSWGIDNSGRMTFDYNIEFQDTQGTDVGVFNGYKNRLWNLVEANLGDDIKSFYKTIRSRVDGLSYDAIMNMLYTEGIARYPEAIYNEDTKIKYISEYKDNNIDYLSSALGSQLEHLKFWANGRINYLDAKYETSDFTDDKISMRVVTVDSTLAKDGVSYYSLADGVYTEVTGLTAGTSAVDGYYVKNGESYVLISAKNDYSFALKPYVNTYLEAQYATNYFVKQRASKNVTYTINPPSAAGNLNDTETYLFGASSLLSIGDLSSKHLTLLDISKASRLETLTVGSDNPAYYNDNLKTIAFGANKLLRTAILTNVTGLVGNIDVSKCDALEDFEALGTKITSVSFAEGGNLKTAHLPATINALTLKNLSYLTDLTIANGGASLSSIAIENTNGIDSYALVKSASDSGSLNYVRCIGISWKCSKAFIQGLMGKKGIGDDGLTTDKAVLSGTVHLTDQAIYAYEIADLQEYYGTSLKIEWDDGIALQKVYRVRYVNYDGVTDLEKDQVNDGAASTYTMARPVKPDPVGQELVKGYYFKGWFLDVEATKSADSALASVTGNLTVFAGFDLVDYRTATFQNYDGTVLATTKTIDGYSPVYSGTTPTKPNNTASREGYDFNGWSPALSSITADTTYVAQYATVALMKATFVSEGTTVLESYFKTGEENVVYTGTTPTKDPDYTNGYSYKFSAWSPAIGTTITADTTYTAQYTQSTLYKIVFYAYNKTDVLATKWANYGDSVTYDGTAPTKADDLNYKNYIFKSWKNVTGDAVVSSTNTIENIKGSLNVYAYFEGTVQTYTVVFKNGDTVLETDTVAYGSAAVFGGTNPTKTNYSFGGWNTDSAAEDGLASLVLGDGIAITSIGQTITLYAIFVIQFKMKFVFYNLFTSSLNISIYIASGTSGNTVNFNMIESGSVLSSLSSSTTSYTSFPSISLEAGKKRIIYITADSDDCLILPNNPSDHSGNSLLTECVVQNIKKLPNNLFYNDSNLQKVSLSSITTIGDNSFKGCSISSIQIPDSVTTIGDGAFSYSKITSIHIPSLVSEISSSNNGFCCGCPLESISVSSDNAYYATDGRSIWKKSSMSLIGYAGNSGTSYQISSSIKVINYYCFSGSSTLKSITIPSSVTSINNYAFQGCIALTDVVIPSSVKTIPYGAFQDCDALANITIPSSITSIASSAFYKTNSSSVNITVTMASDATTPPTLSIGVFNTTYLTAIYVPSSAVDTYKAATNWSTFASYIQAGTY